MADGEVLYEIRGDDSKLEGDLDSAQKKAEQSSKKAGESSERIEKKTSDTIKKEQEEVTKHHKQENDKRVKDDEETGKQREDTEKSVSGKIKDIISDAADQNPVIGSVSKVTDGLSGAGAAWLGVGAAAAAVGGIAVKSATDMDQAMNQFIASTGKGQEETERYQKVLEDIYANNYGENFEDIAQGMAEINKQLGDMSDEKLQNIAEGAFALRDTFGYEIPESTRAAKAMIDNLGVDGEKALSLIAAGAQNGLDFSGELLDSISEYSVQFAKVGLDADDMFKIFQAGADSGAFNLDKVGDAIKEMAIRVVDGSDTTREGFEAIGLNADDMAARFAAGGESAKKAFQETVNALAAMEDPLAQNTAGINLFGTQWEDLGVDAVTALAAIGDEAYATADDMKSLQEVKYDDLGSMLEGLQRSLELLLIPLGEALIPLLTTLIEAILPVVTELLQPLLEMAMGFLEPLLTLISGALEPLIEILMELITVGLQPIMPVLELLLTAFEEVFTGILSTVTDVLQNNVMTIFQNLIDFIKNVFTGNWKGAWENISNIFKNIVEAFVKIFKMPINGIIDLINGFLKGLNKIKFPDWVPGVGGKGFNISLIPRLKKGLKFVPGDFFPAYLDYGERVLTQEENLRFSALGGMEGIEQRLSAGQNFGSEQRIMLQKGSIMVIAQIDGKDAAVAMAPYMDTELGSLADQKGRGL
ncbi:MAG TPA: phage tail tape measure protein [Candidatus Eisenbergiella merdigallinarum]|uniref:Phage tail tape measure protein n=1 Tax=Candidatus Eisenbergiella merdigallinarum TaxID=2838552 RepID=A0A9D2SBK3_9FIRM|nr:phage tail tape measure protein [Candidatus Eisenbergiella merdigallinarum]